MDRYWKTQDASEEAMIYETGYGILELTNIREACIPKNKMLSKLPGCKTMLNLCCGIGRDIN